MLPSAEPICAAMQQDIQPPPRTARRRAFHLGFVEFVALVAALMALNALSIDPMLPALPDIGNDLRIADAEIVDDELHRPCVIHGGQRGIGVYPPAYTRTDPAALGTPTGTFVGTSLR